MNVAVFCGASLPHSEQITEAARQLGRAIARGGHYRAFVTYLNAVQELQPEESLSKAAQYYNADLAKIDLQYQQSRKKGGKDDEPTPETETTEEI